MTTAQIKFVKSLSQKKFRDQYGLFVAEGEKLVAEALHSRFKVRDVYRADEIGEAAMARMTGLCTPSPVLCTVERPGDLVNGDLPAKGLFLALDGIRDPGNLGTILRIADWFGIDAVFASPDTVDVFNPKVVQATMGAIFRVKFHYTDIPSLCNRALTAGGAVYGTFLDGENIYEKSLSNGVERPSIIVIGNEANGISSATAACVSHRLYIPPFPADDPGSESLNAAVATAVTVAEFRRLALKSFRS
ncbi:MAG: RNA methyltransferase [Bacteroidales bacterium]|nr:RNA methyltransferase [Bacteroidales bacterium]